ncbi:MAG: ABC transporter ATP-binding protein [Nitrospirota bacterium]
MILLQIQEVAKTFGGLRAVDAVSLNVEQGKITSLIGPNGAGKTTLFNCITGAIPPTAGTISFNGQAITNLKSYQIARSGISRTFQNIRLFPDMTVIENVMVGGYMSSLPTRNSFFKAIFRGASFYAEEGALRKKATELLDFVGISRQINAEARSLSYGDQRRLEIARGLAAGPTLFLLDEPAAGMNPKETEELMALIKKIQSRNITVFLIEHNMKMVMGISDHIVVLDHGVKIAEGVPQTILENAQVIEAYLGCQKVAVAS